MWCGVEGWCGRRGWCHMLFCILLSCIRASAVARSMLEVYSATSSANRLTITSGGILSAMSSIYIVKSSGLMTEPWGTPCFITRFWLLAFPNVTYASRLLSQLWVHRTIRCQSLSGSSSTGAHLAILCRTLCCSRLERVRFGAWVSSGTRRSPSGRGRGAGPLCCVCS